MLIAVLLIMLGGVGAVAFIVRRSSSQVVPLLETRMERFGIGGPSALAIPTGAPKAHGVSQGVERLVGRGRLAGSVARRLERADIKATPAEFLSIACAVLVGFTGIGLVVIGTLGALILGLVGAIAPWFYLRRRQKKRAKKFEGQLADMAQMLANSMRAGFSIFQSMEMASNEGPSPAKEEFQRVVTEVELGLQLDTALEHLLDRMPSEDLSLMVVAITVQRQVGGNLAEILNVISETVRARVRFQRDLRALTAQARYSSYVITGLPVAVFIAINFMDREYESYLYTAALGHVMLGIAATMIAIGFFFLSKLSNIEV